MSDKKSGVSRGCLIAGALLFIIWLLGGCLLWRAALDAPRKDETKKYTPFSFIPDDEEEDESDDEDS